MNSRFRSFLQFVWGPAFVLFLLISVGGSQAEQVSSEEKIYQLVYADIQSDGMSRAIAKFADRRLPKGELVVKKISDISSRAGYRQVQFRVQRGTAWLCATADIPHCENCPYTAGYCE